MDYSVTGIAYLFLSFAVAFIIYRVFQYWKKERDIISKLWLYVSLIFGLFIFTKAIGGLFFATNLTFLKFTINFGVFLQALAFSTMSYFSVYVKFSPKISPWWGFFPTFVLGMIATYLTIISPFEPFLESSGAINWGFPTTLIPTNILRIFLFLIVFIPAIFILLEQFKEAPDVYTKRKVFGFIILFLFLCPAS